MSSSEAIASLSESFNASSGSYTPLSTLTATTFDGFDACMRKTYPDAPTDKLIRLPANRKCKTKGKYIHVCQICRDWSNSNRAIASVHIEKNHTQYLTIRQPYQPTISSFFPAINASTVLRNGFDKRRYNEALVGLFTRRRVPFSMIEWEEFKELCLACNPDIEDLLISSRRQAV